MPVGGEIAPQSLDQSGTVLIAFRNRNPETDERVGLVRAIQRKGISAYCILLRRHPRIAGPSETPPSADKFKPVSLFEMVRLIWRETKNKNVIYLDTTGLNFPATTLTLKTILPRGKWVFDVNDDLLYAHSGFKRTEMRFRQNLISRTSQIVVHAAATLREIFPHSYYLGNASEIQFFERLQHNARKIAILSSLDGRFDFDLVREVAAKLPDHEFHLYGRVNIGAVEGPAVQLKLEKLIREAANLRYHGEYRNHDLPEVLSQYSILFAPYQSKSKLVRYIDPIRFYAGLNSGMEIITTPVPAASGFRDVLHVVESAREAVDTILRLESEPEAMFRNRNPDARRFSWDEKATRLLQIINTLKTV